MYICRELAPNDYVAVSALPQTEEELFYMYPNAKYPLTTDQVQASVQKRLFPTVVMFNEKVVGFANIYGFEEGTHCWLGNVIIDSEHRGKGAATVLIQTMIDLVRTKLNVPKLLLVVHNTNLPALLFYSKIGFQPTTIGKMKNHRDETLAKITMCLDLS